MTKNGDEDTVETPDRKIVILRGVPGAGKSTLARQMVADGWRRVNKDEIRHMINGYKMDNSDEKIVEMVQSMAIIGLMNEGRNIVIDNTHSKQKYIDEILQRVKIHNGYSDLKVVPQSEYHYTVEIKTLDTPLEICIERNAKRDRPVPEEVIYSMHKNLFPQLYIDKK